MFRPVKLGIFVLFLFVAFTGCSVDLWRARFAMFQAESAYEKAHEMRTNKTPYEVRLKLYRRACTHFLQAFRTDAEIFTLYRIEIAEDACARVENTGAREMFLVFEEEYVRTHPTETEYGDAVPMMELE